MKSKGKLYPLWEKQRWLSPYASFMWPTTTPLPPHHQIRVPTGGNVIALYLVLRECSGSAVVKGYMKIRKGKSGNVKQTLPPLPWCVPWYHATHCGMTFAKDKWWSSALLSCTKWIKSSAIMTVCTSHYVTIVNSSAHMVFQWDRRDLWVGIFIAFLLFLVSKIVISLQRSALYIFVGGH